MAQRIAPPRIVGSGQTTDAATPVTLLSFDLAAAGQSPTRQAFDGCSVGVTATFSGYDAAGPGSVLSQQAASFRRVAGTLTQDGVTTAIMAPVGAAALLGCTFRIQRTGTVIQVQILAGIAATTIDWTVAVDIVINQP